MKEEASHAARFSSLVEWTEMMMAQRQTKLGFRRKGRPDALMLFYLLIECRGKLMNLVLNLESGQTGLYGNNNQLQNLIGLTNLVEIYFSFMMQFL